MSNFFLGMIIGVLSTLTVPAFLYFQQIFKGRKRRYKHLNKAVQELKKYNYNSKYSSRKIIRMAWRELTAIKAIKKIRELTNLGLKDAKNIVDAAKEDMSQSHYDSWNR